MTDSGVCCAFNLHMDLKETQYSELVEEMQVNFRNSQIYVAIESSFQGKSGASKYEERQKRKASPGLDRGLKITIDRNFDQ